VFFLRGRYYTSLIHSIFGNKYFIAVLTKKYLSFVPKMMMILLVRGTYKALKWMDLFLIALGIP